MPTAFPNYVNLIVFPSNRIGHLRSGDATRESIIIILMEIKDDYVRQCCDCTEEWSGRSHMPTMDWHRCHSFIHTHTITIHICCNQQTTIRLQVMITIIDNRKNTLMKGVGSPGVAGSLRYIYICVRSSIHPPVCLLLSIQSIKSFYTWFDYVHCRPRRREF